MIDDKLYNIILESVKAVLIEGEYAKGTIFSIKKGVPQDKAKAFLAKKYGIDPRDLYFDGVKNYAYYPRKRRAAEPKAAKAGGGATPKAPKPVEYTGGRGEGESHDDYLNRVRKTNQKFADAEMEIPGEEWRPFPNMNRYFNGLVDFGGTYEISNMGRVRRINYADPMNSRISGGYHSPQRRAMQYTLLGKGEDGRKFKTTPHLHVAVADAFLDKPEGNLSDYYVGFKDGDYRNTRADNLEYRPKKRGSAKSAAQRVKDDMDSDIKAENFIRNMVRQTILECLRRR